MAHEEDYSRVLDEFNSPEIWKYPLLLMIFGITIAISIMIHRKSEEDGNLYLISKNLLIITFIQLLADSILIQLCMLNLQDLGFEVQRLADHCRSRSEYFIFIEAGLFFLWVVMSWIYLLLQVRSLFQRQGENTNQFGSLWLNRILSFIIMYAGLGYFSLYLPDQTSNFFSIFMYSIHKATIDDMVLLNAIGFIPISILTVFVGYRPNSD